MQKSKQKPSAGLSIAPAPVAPARLLTLAQVKELTGLSEASIYRLRRAGKFPPPLKIAARRVGWIETEVSAWIVELERIDLSTPASTT